MTRSPAPTSTPRPNRTLRRLAAGTVLAAVATSAAVVGTAGGATASPGLPSNCWEAGWYDQIVRGVAGYCYNDYTGYVDWYGFHGDYGTSYQDQ